MPSQSAGTRTIAEWGSRRHTSMPPSGEVCRACLKRHNCVESPEDAMGHICPAIGLLSKGVPVPVDCLYLAEQAVSQRAQIEAVQELRRAGLGSG